jgi:hypothetical protein
VRHQFGRRQSVETNVSVTSRDGGRTWCPTRGKVPVGTAAEGGAQRVSFEFDTTVIQTELVKTAKL